MKPSKPSTLLIRLEAEQAEYLRERAAREGNRSVSSLVRELVTRAAQVEAQQQTA